MDDVGSGVTGAIGRGETDGAKVRVGSNVASTGDVEGAEGVCPSTT